MGSGASLREDESMLLSAEDVTAARLQDHYTSKLKRNEELLRQAALQADVIGYKAAAPFAQPIMKEKLEGMQVLGDVHASYCEDQRRWEGHSLPGRALCGRTNHCYGAVGQSTSCVRFHPRTPLGIQLA
eukprot:symbB.v1.2.016981.t1/scaffold1297.1/size126219/5